MSDEIKVFHLPKPQKDMGPKNLVFHAQYAGLRNPVFLGFNTEGKLVIACENMTTERLLFMLEQARLNIMGASNK